MAIKRYKPITPGTRQKTVSAFTEITTTTPEKSLLEVQSKSDGRNSNGQIGRAHV